ncbi:plastocyanin/azurin family copper-binding protein [Aliifodinibius salicampi]|uniref:Plastocyanin/azurin family copper-binding protein n=1 Tax=Fodinibius salicampi TaxID=1920655 RepID=A0ABT3PXE5_9BACT|nr:plastocyanin/azurin family copper-binding protein [Fodinibius salicampi]MCW9712540.1 plastocyanin/azurin family copper-binding protein [Fodinibius salicampi]
MKTLTKITLILAVLFTGVISSAMAQRTIEIIGTDNMKFDVTTIEATPGEEITIKLTTKSQIPKQAMAHNVVVLDKDTEVDAFANASARARDNEYLAPDYEDQIVAATGLAGGGETVEVTFTVPEDKGDYEYICSFPGHYAAGMKGILTVK